VNDGSDEGEDEDLDVGALVAAIAAGYFANAAEYDRTEYDPRAADRDAAGTHVYRLLRHPVTAPGYASGIGGGSGGSGSGNSSSASGPKLRIHPSSVLWRARPELVVFARCAAGDGGWHDMQGVTAVPRAVLRAAAPHYFRWRGGG
jgi:ATP-dependent RNA helicase DDX35